ncbi:MAG TPA: hypothetical protein VEZ51_00205, partial [Gemmatimonadaceae bacterium]|nr:hypothetical protein [Gemmatimonadaceae bacterium]
MRLPIIAMLFAVTRLAEAQFPAEVQGGTRVRVWIPEPARQAEGPNQRQLLRGTVESVDAGVLRLRVPDERGIASDPVAPGTLKRRTPEGARRH